MMSAKACDPLVEKENSRNSREKIKKERNNIRAKVSVSRWSQHLIDCSRKASQVGTIGGDESVAENEKVVRSTNCVSTKTSTIKIKFENKLRSPVQNENSFTW